jgi:flagellar protein FliO/FliZ
MTSRPNESTTLSGRVGRLVAGAAGGGTAAFLAATAAFAQEPGATPAAEGAGVGSGVATFGLGDWFGLAVRLALVVAVIWGGVAAMRWYVRRMNGAKGRGAFGALEVMETHALGPNRTLHLVRLGDRAVLIGATPERITQLLTVDDPEELERLSAQPDDTSPVRATRGGVASLISSLGAGMSVLKAMNARRREVDARMKAQRDGQREAQRQVRQASRPARPRGEVSAEHALEGRTPGRLANLKNALARSTAQRATFSERAMRPTAEPETRQSLFDRTLASIEAVEIEPEGARASSAARGLRARTGYGQAASLPGSAAGRGGASGRARDAQIADLQRAIAAARRNVG